MGFLSDTVTVNVAVSSPADEMGTNPEKNPWESGWQGSENEDWVTLWFCERAG
jgi:hypothetical protein